MLKKQISFKLLSVFLFVNSIILIGSVNSSGQSGRDYGNVGTLKIFAGQIKDEADGLIPNATIKVKSLDSNEEKSIEADRNVFLELKICRQESIEFESWLWDFIKQSLL